MRRSRASLGPLLACLVLTACTGQPTPGPQPPDEASVDVDTPALRALRHDAHVEPCRPAATAPTRGGLPEVTLQCLGGGTPVPLAGLRGPLVLTVFAQWCGPCRTELPYYQRLHQRGRGVLRVVGVDYLDTQPDGALRLARTSGVTFPLLADPAGRLRAPLSVRGLPTVVFVAADGTVTSVQARAFRSYADLRHAVQQQLGVRLPG